MDSEPIRTQTLGSKSKCTLSSETPTGQYPGRGAHATRDLQGSGWCHATPVGEGTFPLPYG